MSKRTIGKPTLFPLTAPHDTEATFLGKIRLHVKSTLSYTVAMILLEESISGPMEAHSYGPASVGRSVNFQMLSDIFRPTGLKPP